MEKKVPVRCGLDRVRARVYLPRMQAAREPCRRGGEETGEKRMSERMIAYFTMEIALEAHMPTYSGGLGALAGDTVRSAADLKVSMVVVTLLHRKGYFHQKLDPGGWQTEEPVAWIVEDFLEEQTPRIKIQIEQRE